MTTHSAKQPHYTDAIMQFCSQYTFASIDDAQTELKKYEIPTDLNKSTATWLHRHKHDETDDSHQNTFITYGGVLSINPVIEEKFQRFFQSVEQKIQTCKNAKKSAEPQGDVLQDYQAYFDLNVGAHWVALVVSIQYDLTSNSYTTGRIEIYDPMKNSRDSSNFDCVTQKCYLSYNEDASTLANIINRHAPSETDLICQNTMDLPRVQSGEVINCGPYTIAIKDELVKLSLRKTDKIKPLEQQGYALRHQQIQWMQTHQKQRLIDSITIQSQNDYESTLSYSLKKQELLNQKLKHADNATKINTFIKTVTAKPYYLDILNTWNDGDWNPKELLETLRQPETSKDMMGAVLKQNLDLLTSGSGELPYNAYLEALHEDYWQAVRKFSSQLTSVLTCASAELKQLSGSISHITRQINQNKHKHIYNTLTQHVFEQVKNHIQKQLEKSNSSVQEQKFYFLLFLQTIYLADSSCDPQLVAEYRKKLLTHPVASNITTCLKEIFSITDAQSIDFFNNIITDAFTEVLRTFYHEAKQWNSFKQQPCLLQNTTIDLRSMLLQTIRRTLSSTTRHTHSERLTYLLKTQQGKNIIKDLLHNFAQHKELSEQITCLESWLTTTPQKVSSKTEQTNQHAHLESITTLMNSTLQQYTRSHIIDGKEVSFTIFATPKGNGLLDFCRFLQQPNQIRQIYHKEISERIKKIAEIYPPSGANKENNPLEIILLEYIFNKESYSNSNTAIDSIDRLAKQHNDPAISQLLLDLIYSDYSCSPTFVLDTLIEKYFSSIDDAYRRTKKIEKIEQLIQDMFINSCVHYDTKSTHDMLVKYNTILLSFPATFEKIRSKLRQNLHFSTEPGHTHEIEQKSLLLAHKFKKSLNTYCKSYNKGAEKRDKLFSLLHDLNLDEQQRKDFEKILIDPARYNTVLKLIGWLNLYSTFIQSHNIKVKSSSTSVDFLQRLNSDIKTYLAEPQNSKHEFRNLISMIQRSLLSTQNIHHNSVIQALFDSYQPDNRDYESIHLLNNNKLSFRRSINAAYQLYLSSKDRTKTDPTIQERLSMFFQPERKKIKEYLMSLSNNPLIHRNIFTAEHMIHIYTHILNSAQDSMDLFKATNDNLNQLENQLLKRNQDKLSLSTELEHQQAPAQQPQDGFADSIKSWTPHSYAGGYY